ncbi:hypothetical protein GCM10027610_135220 [Dactylosporangium cerinum]
MTAWTVMLRGIRYRAGRSFVVFLLAVTATTAAVLAPAYSRAAQQSVLTDGLSAASTDATGLTVGAKGTADSAAFKDLAEIRLAMNTALAKDQLLADRLDLPVAAIDTEIALGDVSAKLAFRDNACYHLTIDGDCPDNPGEIAVSRRTATAQNLKVGDRLTVRMGPATGGHDKTFTIRGVYTPKDGGAAYWGRTSYFSGSETTADALFSMTEDDLRLERAATLTTRLEYPLRADRVRLDDVAGLRDGIQTLGDRLRGEELEVTTTLPAVLRDIDTDQSSIGRTAPVIAVPLLLLCWFVLFLLVASLTEERAPEIALAKLRGYPAGRAARFGLGEVLLLTTAAVPVGIAAGLLLVQAAAGALLADGVRVEVRWPVFAAAGLALVAGLAAAVLAGRQTLARPVLGLLRRVPERGGWRAGVADGVVVALAAASLAAAVNDRGSPLALLAPPLLAVVLGIAAARLLGLWSQARLRIARRRGRIVPLLSAAQLSRRPGGQRLVVVVTVAVALLTFAATAWDAAAQARRDAADDTVGAQRVLTVAADHPAALEAAVDKADPGGHAMAVVRASQRFDNAPVELIGVQSGRLADIAVWRGHSRAEVGDLAARLHPNVAAPLRVGKDLAAEISVDALPAKPALRVAAIVAAPGQPPRTVPLGGLGKGTKSYHAALTGCATGCRLVGLAIGRAAGGSEPFAVSVAVRALSTDGAPSRPASTSPAAGGPGPPPAARRSPSGPARRSASTSPAATRPTPSWSTSTRPRRCPPSSPVARPPTTRPRRRSSCPDSPTSRSRSRSRRTPRGCPGPATAGCSSTSTTPPGWPSAAPASPTTPPCATRCGPPPPHPRTSTGGSPRRACRCCAPRPSTGSSRSWPAARRRSGCGSTCSPVVRRSSSRSAWCCSPPTSGSGPASTSWPPCGWPGCARGSCAGRCSGSTARCSACRSSSVSRPGWWAPW